VTWDAEGTGSDKQNIHFLHGALHLFDFGSDLQKRCWERGGGVPLIDQIRASLSDGRFPLFVSEGNTQAKLARIRHSGYLQRSLRSFAAVCRVQNSALFVFGHSLAENDSHAIDRIAKGKVTQLYIGVHGGENDDGNRVLIARAQNLAARRNDQNPLDVKFFASASTRVWEDG
jgi:Domain of unknown function (DUF4917)